MELFVISKVYQPLVEVNLKAKAFSFKSHPITKKTVTSQDLKATFNIASSKPYIACFTQEDADFILGCLLKHPNTAPDFIEPGVHLFASPVIYKIEVDELSLGKERNLTPQDLVGYADVNTIPLMAPTLNTELEASRLQNDVFSKLNDPKKICLLNSLSLEEVSSARYLNTSATKMIDHSLKPGLGLWSFFNFCPCLKAQKKR